jgi:cyclase
MPRDNSGLIVGSEAALLIDAGINGAVAAQLQALAARLTDKPLKYLVNTNYHGDHTFGNYAFPASVEIVAHRLTAESMADLDYEKRIRSRNLFGHEAAIADVTWWRKPDRVFEDRLDIDLGGRTVQLRHFGPGNTPGDTVVYVADERIAWTGNFVSNERIIPMLLEIGPLEYIDTLARCKAALDIRTIVPGHGPLGTPIAFEHTMRYLWTLYQDVKAAFDAGLSAEGAVDAVALRPEFELPWWVPIRRLRALMKQFHRLDVLFVYRQLERARGPMRTESAA